MTLTGLNEVVGKKPILVQHCPSHIPQGLAGCWTWTSKVTCHWLNTWAMAQTGVMLKE